MAKRPKYLEWLHVAMRIIAMIMELLDPKDEEET